MTSVELESGHIRVTEHGPLLHATLARPDKLNALNRAMYVDLCRVVDHLDAQDNLHALLLDGEGRSFCAGNDIKEFADADPRSGGADEVSVAMQYVHRLMATDKPVIMAAHGNATGIGTTMLLHSDLVIAADSTRLYTAFVDLGLVPEAGSSLILPERVGRQNAARLLLAGDTITADEAERMGLVAYRCRDDELADKALALGKALAAKPPQSMQQTKQLMRHGSDAIHSQIKRETKRFAERLFSDEARAIFAQFLSKSK